MHGAGVALAKDDTAKPVSELGQTERRHRGIIGDNLSVGGAVGWVLLLSASLVHYRLAIFGRELGLSPFDWVLAAMAIGLVAAGRVRLGRRGMMVTGAAIALVVAHDLAVFALGTPIETGGVIRETVKYIAFPVLVALAAVVFSDAAFRRLPALPIACWTVVLGLAAVIQVALGVGIAHHADKFGIYANLLVAALVLSVVAAEREDRPVSAWLAVLAGIVTVAATFHLYAKSLSAAAMAISGIAALLHVRARLVRLTLRTKLIMAGIGCLVAAVAVALAFDVAGWGGQVKGTTGQSLGVRSALWDRAIGLARVSFPLGIGLGQFGAQPDPVRDVFGQAQLFVHNTPLAMVTELGALGFAALAGFLALIGRSLAALPQFARLAAAIYLGATFVLNDGFGYRGAILILGLGLGLRAAEGQRPLALSWRLGARG